MFRRKTTQAKRDEAIKEASDLMHTAIRKLRMAHYHAAAMHDDEFATALWMLAEDIPIITREIDAHLYDWQAIHMQSRRLPVRNCVAI